MTAQIPAHARSLLDAQLFYRSRAADMKRRSSTQPTNVITSTAPAFGATSRRRSGASRSVVRGACSGYPSHRYVRPRRRVGIGNMRARGPRRCRRCTTRWLGTLTGVHDPPSEPKATCGDCVMCAGVERSGSYVTFSPDVKCCSYVPHLANFLVGRSLLGPGTREHHGPDRPWGGGDAAGTGPQLSPTSAGSSGRSPISGARRVVVCPHFVEETQGLRRSGRRATWCAPPGSASTSVER